MTALTPDRDRRLAAERDDERVDPVVTSLNAIAPAAFVAASDVPATAGLAAP